MHFDYEEYRGHGGGDRVASVVFFTDVRSSRSKELQNTKDAPVAKKHMLVTMLLYPHGLASISTDAVKGYVDIGVAVG